MADVLHEMWAERMKRYRIRKDQREERVGSGLDAMAEAIGVRSATISRWESGKLVPRDAMKLAIAEYLEEQPDLLFPLIRMPV